MQHVLYVFILAGVIDGTCHVGEAHGFAEKMTVVAALAEEAAESPPLSVSCIAGIDSGGGGVL